MRARELREDYNQSLESDLNNLLMVAKGNGLYQIRTQDLADQLYGMGYSVNVNSLIPLLNSEPSEQNPEGGNPSIESATPEMITLTSPEGTPGGNGETDAEADADKVSDMAMQQADTDLKKDNIAEATQKKNLAA